jgi:hypothetical protein
MKTAWMSAAGVMVMACGLVGCVSYANYPPVAKDTAVHNVNAPAMEEVMMAGLRWVAQKYPPSPSSLTGQPSPMANDVAVNLPGGVKPKVYRRVAAAVPGGQPLTEENQHLPTYHLSSIRIRGDQANVWILRPVTGLGASPRGGPVYQEIKLWLRGGLAPWHVVSSLEMSPGAVDAPALAFYEPEAAPETRESVALEGSYKPRPKAVAEPAPVVTGQEPMPPGGESPKP